ncbi:MAG: FixH family protein [Deltaproteobacteria bacterium]|nr:FixH family protein [Deltaproteobacteria bacterium]
MKRFATVVVILLFVAGFAYAKDYMIIKKAGNYMVHVKIDKNPPVTGLNKMEIGIQDTMGADVTDAIVSVEYSMPAMPGMPAMNYKTKSELKNKKYLATLNFSMSGAWNVVVKISRAGKTQSVKFNVDVS